MLEVRYLIVGIINTIFSILIYPILYFIMNSLEFSYLVPLVLSYLLTSVFSFITQRYFVFLVKTDFIQRYFVFLLAQSFLLCINFLLLPILIELFGYSPVITQTVFVIFVIIISYLWSKFIVFN